MNMIAATSESLPVGPLRSNSPWKGVVQIVRFNWARYAVASTVIAVCVAALALFPVSQTLQVALVAGAICAGYWTVTSLIVSHWVYDRSALTDWSWLRSCVPHSDSALTTIVNIHAGFDDTSLRVRELFSRSELIVVDLYDARRMTEASIQRARAQTQNTCDTLPGRPEALPAGSSSTDCVMLLMSAHEVRMPDARRKLFGEVARILKPGGRVVLVEHFRDAWNFLAFGPGAFHFFSRREWLSVVGSADLNVTQQGRITPFVRYLVLAKAGSRQA